MHITYIVISMMILLVLMGFALSIECRVKRANSKRACALGFAFMLLFCAMVFVAIIL